MKGTVPRATMHLLQRVVASESHRLSQQKDFTTRPQGSRMAHEQLMTMTWSCLSHCLSNTSQIKHKALAISKRQVERIVLLPDHRGGPKGHDLQSAFKKTCVFMSFERPRNNSMPWQKMESCHGSSVDGRIDPLRIWEYNHCWRPLCTIYNHLQSSTVI